MPKEVIVVGAGLAGLYVARRLKQRGTGHVRVLEARPRPGGRIRTVYDEDGRTRYEAGPWRVPSNHRCVRALFAELGVPLVPLSTPTPIEYDVSPRSTTGMSIWDTHALIHRDALRADLADLATGYADETRAASGTAPYMTSATQFFVAPEGFDTIITGLDGDHVTYDARVVDIVAKGRRYELQIVVRKGHNLFSTKYVSCDVLFVCVPPHVCREWTVFKEHARSVMNAVEADALHHIYVEHDGAPRNVHHKDPNSIVGQVVSTQYNNEWFQASYTAGRLARLWHNLLLATPSRFWSTLREELQTLIGIKVPASANYASHYWPVAYHRWKPVPHFSLARAVRAAVRPNPSRLPHVYLAGEAFSSHQAWMEGALETAELALVAYWSPSPPRTLRDDVHVVVQVEGHTLDVSKWMQRHPGGREALENHIGEDVTALMAHLQHSDHAWAVVHALKE